MNRIILAALLSAFIIGAVGSIVYGADDVLTTPVITSVTVTRGMSDTGNVWKVQDGIYPSRRLRISGNNFVGSDIIGNRDPVSVLLDSTRSLEVIERFTNTLIVYLPQDVTPGSRTLTVENWKGMRTSDFVIEVLANCTADLWQCSEWDACTPQSEQRRTCVLVENCNFANTPKPVESQTCAYVAPPLPVWTPPAYVPPTYVPYVPPVEEKKPVVQQPIVPQTIDVGPTVAMPSPVVQKVDYKKIIATTVQLKCPTNMTSVYLGSGTIVDSDGVILTNRHVVEKSLGFCKVGFVNSLTSVPMYLYDADVVQMSSAIDAAILKIRDPKKKFEAVTVQVIDFDTLTPGEEFLAFGYPGIGGKSLTVTKGSYGGVDGDYVKSDIRIAGGNSGGGAYVLRNGAFLGMPSAGRWDPSSGDSLNLVLSVNKIVQWIKTNEKKVDAFAPSKLLVLKSKKVQWKKMKIVVPKKKK